MFTPFRGCTPLVVAALLSAACADSGRLTAPSARAPARDVGTAAPSVTLTVNGGGSIVTAMPGDPLAVGWASSGSLYCMRMGGPWAPALSYLPTLSGTETVVAPTTSMSTGYAVSVDCVDAANVHTSATVQVNVGVGVNDKTPIGFSPSLPAAVVGTPYSARLSATGLGPFTFAAGTITPTTGVMQPGLPPGLTLSSDGAVGGVPTAEGDFRLALTATDATGITRGANATLHVGGVASGSFTIVDDGRAVITAVGTQYVVAAGRTIVYDAATRLRADNGIAVGRTADWRGQRDPSTGVVHADRLEVR